MRKKKKSASKNRKGHLERPPAHAPIFLPDNLSVVKAIALRGLSDDEIAAHFCLDPALIQDWKKFYPSFKEAIEKGRTMADVKVVQSLFAVATGQYEAEVAVKNGIRVLRKHKPDIGGIKMWLTNRDKENWSDRQSLDGGGTRGGGTKPLIPTESRNTIIDDIVALVKSKPDGETTKK